MAKYGFEFPAKPRHTALWGAEDWYQKLLAERFNRPYEPLKTSNFGEYEMAVNYLTSVLEEARAIDKVAIFNIDHMAQIQFTGKDSVTLLDRVLPANVESMKIGQCKYTMLLNDKGGVVDDLIIMRVSNDNFILVINAGHDLTDVEKGLKADIDHIMDHIKDGEDVIACDISDKLVKIDIQGPLSYKLISKLYGVEVLRNRNKPTKNMAFFTFNEFDFEGEKYFISRTGYTNRWGWEFYIPTSVAEAQFKRIASEALELGGLVVGLGGRDENRISAGNLGLPLNGSEYDQKHTPVNSPLFNAAVDMTKDSFVGKSALEATLALNPTKRMTLVISEGIVTGRGIYLKGERIGTVTSSINSPNVTVEKREFLASKRKSVNGENGTCAIGLGWINLNPYNADAEGKDILVEDGSPVKIRVELFREDEEKNPKGKAVTGYISADGVSVATGPKPLKHIQSL